ncbi:hypothetical protein Tsp_08221 [Trichinella spiralis]|uniref:hypothetical protein n=1 Tax=Trichinella spiralis TaxID=6334 RepID=UPI0001EFEA55|nr:hypothetical protein Tsp_08221 [Trichinella spiralis]
MDDNFPSGYCHELVCFHAYAPFTYKSLDDKNWSCVVARSMRLLLAYAVGIDFSPNPDQTHMRKVIRMRSLALSPSVCVSVFKGYRFQIDCPHVKIRRLGLGPQVCQFNRKAANLKINFQLVNSPTTLVGRSIAYRFFDV